MIVYRVVQFWIVGENVAGLRELTEIGSLLLGSKGLYVPEIFVEFGRTPRDYVYVEACSEG